VQEFSLAGWIPFADADCSHLPRECEVKPEGESGGTTGTIAAGKEIRIEPFRLPFWGNCSYGKIQLQCKTIKRAFKRRRTRINVFITLGQEVATLVDAMEHPGYKWAQWDAGGMASGVYFYRLQVRPLDSAIGRHSKSGAGDFVQTRKLLVLR